MKKLLIAIMLVLAVAIIAGSVIAGLTFPGPANVQAPSDGTVLTSTSVNFSSMINDTSNGRTTFNWTVYNSTNRANYTVLFSMTVTNGTFVNKTVVMADSVRHYWYSNYTNASGAGSAQVTGRKTFNVDANYNRVVIGSATLNLNITLY